MLERWREETAKNGRGVSGWAATMEAASDGRVDCLLAQEGANRPGWQCPQCGRRRRRGRRVPARRHGDGGERRGPRPRRPPDARARRHDLDRAAPPGPRAGRRNRRAASLLARLTPPGPRTEYDLDARDGRTLRVAEYGDQDGFPILFCHGTPGSRLDRHPDPATYARLPARLLRPARLRRLDAAARARRGRGRGGRRGDRRPARDRPLLGLRRLRRRAARARDRRPARRPRRAGRGALRRRADGRPGVRPARRDRGDQRPRGRRRRGSRRRRSPRCSSRSRRGSCAIPAPSSTRSRWRCPRSTSATSPTRRCVP